MRIFASFFKVLAASALSLLFCSLLLAQQASSEFGWTVPVSGQIRVFVVFAEVEFDNTCPNRPGTNAATAEWPRLGLPEYRDSLFDHSAPVGAPAGIATDYYYQMSFGRYLVLGDYYPNLVTMPARVAGVCQQLPVSSDVLDRIAAAHASGPPISTAHGHGLNDFDLWTQTPRYLSKPPTPDLLGDIALVFWRNYNENAGTECVGPCATGSIGSGYSGIFGGLDGFAQIGQFTAGSPLYTSLLPILFHEYSHVIFGGNDFHIGDGARSFGRHTFFLPQGPYGMTAHNPSVSNVANGWDRNQLGWRNPGRAHLISALDGTGTLEVPSDMRIDTHPDGATFILRDFVTTGDAVRIKLPHLSWQPGQAKNQYLWLENHQSLLKRFDGTTFAEGRLFDLNQPGFPPCLEKWSPGLHALIQVGKDMKNVDLDGNGTVDPADITSEPNNQPSYLFPLTAEGSYDFFYRFDQTSPPGNENCQWGNVGYPIERSRSLPNPFTGYQDVFSGIDGGNGNVLHSATFFVTDPLTPGSDGVLLNDSPAVLVESVGNQIVRRLPSFGDAEDTFSFATGHTRLSLSTNPAPTPVYTFATAGYDTPSQTASPYDNRTIWLNGLSIEILQERPMGADGNAVVVRVRWDDHRVVNDVRWTGNIVLQRDTADPRNRVGKVILGAGKTLYLDRGLSPTEHYVQSNVTIDFPSQASAVYPAGLPAFQNGYLFNDPTTMTIKANTKLHLEAGAVIELRNGSTLIADPTAEIQLEPGAQIRVVNGVYTPNGAQRVFGDVSQPPDGCVDRQDLNILIEEATGRRPRNPLHDFNEDGKVDIADARKLVLYFSRPGGSPCIP